MGDACRMVGRSAPGEVGVGGGEIKTEWARFNPRNRSSLGKDIVELHSVRLGGRLVDWGEINS